MTLTQRYSSFINYASLAKIIPVYINEIFLPGDFPDHSKEAEIIPFYKRSGSNQEIAIYRPNFFFEYHVNNL